MAGSANPSIPLNEIEKYKGFKDKLKKRIQRCRKRKPIFVGNWGGYWRKVVENVDIVMQ